MKSYIMRLGTNDLSNLLINQLFHNLYLFVDIPEFSVVTNDFFAAFLSSFFL